MGKMKGNRLNTAANVGTFVTGRQQIGVQRKLLDQGAAGAELAAMQLQQLQEAKRQQWLEAEVSSGRMTREQALLEIETQAFNQRNEPPEPSDRLAPTLLGRAAYLLTYFGTPAGWYQEGREARYWDGQRWTLVKVSRKEAYRHMEAGTVPDGVLPAASPAEALEQSLPAAPAAPAPPPPPVIPDGWYPDATLGLQRHWQAGAWTEHTRPAPPTGPPSP